MKKMCRKCSSIRIIDEHFQLFISSIPHRKKNLSDRSEEL